VNRGVSLGHDGILEEFVSLGPSCVFGAFVHLLPGAYVGAGAVVLPNVTVGKNAVVGAGAVVVSEVPDRAVVVGNPARVIKTDGPGFNGVSV
jgi:acetyltransferase-like isoleucine patch superfamily enzyme